MIMKLHHNAYRCRDSEETRRFYEELIGLPLVATWCESDELFGKTRTYCHCFFALADGSALTLSSDTGPLHMAVALDRPVISLMGSTNPKRVGPYRRGSGFAGASGCGGAGSQPVRPARSPRSTTWPARGRC